MCALLCTYTHVHCYWLAGWQQAVYLGEHGFCSAPHSSSNGVDRQPDRPVCASRVRHWHVRFEGRLLGVSRCGLWCRVLCRLPAGCKTSKEART